MVAISKMLFTASVLLLAATTKGTPPPPPPPLPPMPKPWPEQFTVAMDQTMPTFPAPVMPGRAHARLHYDHTNLRQRLDLDLFAPAPPAPFSQASILANGTLFIVDLTAKNCTAVPVGVPPPNPSWFVDGSTNLGAEWVMQYPSSPAAPPTYVQAVHLQKWGDPSFGATPFDLYARIGGDGYPVRLVTPYALPPNYPNIFEWQTVQPGAPDPSVFDIPAGITCKPPATGVEDSKALRAEACTALHAPATAMALGIMLPHLPLAGLVARICAH